MQQTPLLLIVLYDSRKRAPGSEGDVLGQMSLGCVLQNIWLTCESLGIDFQVLSVFSNSPVEKQLRRLLVIPEQLKIGFACRLGYTAKTGVKTPHVRRNIEDFVHHNQFGRKEIVWSGNHPG